jgi:hypothetical protein
MNPVMRPDPDLRTEPILSPCSQVDLTRAVVRYEPGRVRGGPGGLLEDLGLGLVLSEASDGSREILDLGSGRRATTILEGPLVILGWVFSATLSRLLPHGSDQEELVRRITVPMAIRVLGEAGFNPQTRPLLLRLGFRDLARDLDPHEGAAIRFLLPGGGVARLHLDYDQAVVGIGAPEERSTDVLIETLKTAFTHAGILHDRATDGTGLRRFRLPFRLPEDLGEARALLARIRRGSLHLLARFEPERHRAVQDQLEVFGARDSLARLAGNAGPVESPVPVSSVGDRRPHRPETDPDAFPDASTGGGWSPAALTSQRVH